MFQRTIVSLLFVYLVFVIPVYAQFDEDYDETEEDTTQEQSGDDAGSPGNFWDRVYLGGDFNLQFGTITFINISPLVGYRITERFSAGPGVTYQYMKFRHYNQAYNTYGGRVFARHTIGDKFLAHTEYEALNRYYYNPVESRFKREWVPGFYAGGGFFQGIGNKGGFNIIILYNFLYDNLRSPNNSPWVIRAGITLSPF